MTMKMKLTEYGAPAKQILAIPDHYVALGFKHAKADAVTPGLATLIDGRYVVKAGTMYPANDATAIGVVLNDYDVTDGDQMMAVVVHGFIKVAALPAVPAAAAVAALPQITFNPLIITLTGTKATITVGETANPEQVIFKLANATFRDGAVNLTNWTIAGETTTNLQVTDIEVAADGQTVTFTLEQITAAQAGSVTVLPDASIISTGKIVSAVTIATVA